MPYCAILECKNDSRTINRKRGGVSYFRFPKDPCRKEKWIDATGRLNWIPARSSCLCSVHFEENDFLISEKGKMYLSEHAVPTLKIMLFQAQNKRNDVDGKPSRQLTRARRIKKEAGQVSNKAKQKSMNEVSNLELDKYSDTPSLTKQSGVLDNSLYLTPREKKLRIMLRHSRNLIIKKNLQLRHLQIKNLRLKRIVRRMKLILNGF